MLRELPETLSKLEMLGAEEVWLFGSHANDRATPKSDIDLLVIGPIAVFEALQGQEAWGLFDIFVNVKGEDEFRSPWRKASGSYSRWKWFRVSDEEATYMATRPNKWRPDTASGFRAKATRIFPSGHGTLL